MAGVSVMTGASVQAHLLICAETTPTTANRLLRFCRAQPELAGLVIGAVLSAPLFVVLLNT